MTNSPLFYDLRQESLDRLTALYLPNPPMYALRSETLALYEAASQLARRTKALDSLLGAPDESIEELQSKSLALRLAREGVAHELAQTVLQADAIAALLGIDLEEAIINSLDCSGK